MRVAPAIGAPIGALFPWRPRSRPGEALSSGDAFRPTRRSTSSWILYDTANTIFSFNILSAYFPVWLSTDLGLRDSVFAIGNSVSMAIIFFLAPGLGAISDRARRRVPFLVASTVACVVATVPLGFVPWQTSIVFFVLANAGFQAGLIFYDALLADVSTPANRGRIGSIGVGVGYLGSLAGLGLGALILTGHEERDSWVFLVTAAAFLVLALPSFFFVREPERPRHALRWAQIASMARQSFAGVWWLLRRPEDPRMRRFLVGRVFYTDAANTMIAFMGIYAVQEAGFDDAGVRIVLLAGILGAALLSPVWGLLVDRAGPKHALDVVLLTWMLGLTVVVLIPVLSLPKEVFFPTAFLLGGALGGTWSADRPLMLGLAPPARLGEFYGIYAMVGRFSAILGPLLWALVVDGLNLGRPTAVATLLGFMLLAFGILRSLPDPIRPGSTPLGPFLPWRAPDGRRTPLPPRWWARMPASVVYLLVTTILYGVWVLVYDTRIENVPSLLVTIFVHEIPELFTNIPRTLVNFALGPWFNYHPVQLLYVYILLLLFGIWFEIREGTRRAVLVFFLSSIISAILAGALLHALAATWDAAWIDREMGRLWAGGSAGAFGLMGAYAARAKRPWPLLLLFVLWEVNVEYWHLKSYTPAFHFIALAAGFVLVRYFLPPKQGPGGPAEAVRPPPQRPESAPTTPESGSGGSAG